MLFKLIFSVFSTFYDFFSDVFEKLAFKLAQCPLWPFALKTFVLAAVSRYHLLDVSLDVPFVSYTSQLVADKS